MTRAEQQSLWAARLARYKASGQGVQEWCATHAVKPQQLWYWLRKERQISTNEIAWLPVDIRNEGYPASLLVHVGQVAVEVRPGFDPKLLADVVHALAV